MNELLIPPAALADPQAFELLRVWASNEEQHVSINSDLNGDESDFGYMLAHLAKHGANLYAEKNGSSFIETLENILTGFKEEINNDGTDFTGEIMK